MNFAATAPSVTALPFIGTPDSGQQIRQQHPLGRVEIGAEIVDASHLDEVFANAPELLDSGLRLAFASLDDAAHHARERLDQLGAQYLEWVGVRVHGRHPRRAGCWSNTIATAR